MRSDRVVTTAFRVDRMPEWRSQQERSRLPEEREQRGDHGPPCVRAVIGRLAVDATRRHGRRDRLTSATMSTSAPLFDTIEPDDLGVYEQRTSASGTIANTTTSTQPPSNVRPVTQMASTPGDAESGTLPYEYRTRCRTEALPGNGIQVSLAFSGR